MIEPSFQQSRLPYKKRVYNLKKDDLLWLAGYLEGEGSFFWKRHNKTNRYYPAISVTTTDEDIANRVKTLLQATAVRRQPKSPNKHHRQSFLIRIESFSILPLLSKLYPLMGERRQEAIEDLLS